MYLGGYGLCDFSFLIWLLLVNMRFIFHSLIYFHPFFISFHFVHEHLFHTLRVTGLIGINVVVDQTLHALNLASISWFPLFFTKCCIPSKSPVFPLFIYFGINSKTPRAISVTPRGLALEMESETYLHMQLYFQLVGIWWCFILWNWDKKKQVHVSTALVTSFGLTDAIVVDFNCEKTL